MKTSLIVLGILIIGLLLTGAYLIRQDQNQVAHEGKESAKDQPSISQMLRSVKPYLTSLDESIPRGTIAFVEIAEGKSFYLYLPPGHDTSTSDFSVLLHLHGAGVFKSWLEHDIHWIAFENERAVELGKAAPMIIVAPLDESKFSMWSDSKDGTNNMASTVINDILPYVESKFKAKATREHRHVQGFSMGGFGAATLGFKYQDLFSTITILDGAMHDWESINQSRKSIVSDQFSDDQEYFENWSPWEMALQADLSKTRIFIIEGLMVDFNTRYFEFLQGLKADVRKVSPKCLHDVECLERTYGVQAFELMSKQQLIVSNNL